MEVDEPAIRVRGLRKSYGDNIAVADVGPHVIRLVPGHHEPAAAAVLLTADVGTRRSAEAFGLHFIIEPAAAPAPG